MSPRRVIVVMGVSGTGKSTIGRALAETLDLPFVEGDDLHSEANVAKMAAGIPLTDADRAPWLDRIAAELDRPVVITCSALKRAYRDRLSTFTVRPSCWQRGWRSATVISCRLLCWSRSSRPWKSRPPTKT
jgi:carbohydrate kinase (thermoresistant glucokinase family)